jgi:hypothetical protein
MSGEQDLNELLKTLSAKLVEGVFVFATFPDGIYSSDLRPRMVFQEEEGTTLILLKNDADAHGISYEFPSRMITLNVHSSLEAVGFMARISSALAARGMGVNPVAGFYHDHLFVPVGREVEAIQILEELANIAT